VVKATRLQGLAGGSNVLHAMRQEQGEHEWQIKTRFCMCLLRHAGALNLEGSRRNWNHSEDAGVFEDRRDVCGVQLCAQEPGKFAVL
jgi:hypothetical protein